jgi:HTH-type transcriptional regulator/antitoxin HigA
MSIEMETLKYKVITSESQYDTYCKALEALVFIENKNQETEDEIELLTLLVETWDNHHRALNLADPIALLQSLMDEHKIKAKDLAEILGMSKGSVSDILNYQKGLSKEVIRKLSDYFKLRQEAFNRSYKLKSTYNHHLKNASVMNTVKQVSNFM